MDTKNFERLLVQALREFSAFAPRQKQKAFAPGWTEAAVLVQVYDICHFAIGNSQQVIPLHRRRRISRLASDLLLEADSGNGARASFWTNCASSPADNPLGEPSHEFRRAALVLPRSFFRNSTGLAA